MEDRSRFVHDFICYGMRRRRKECAASPFERNGNHGFGRNNYRTPETTSAAEVTPLTADEPDGPLTDAPPISLTDALSSTYNRFEVRSGNYSWSYLDGKETVSLVACGSAPLDANQEKADKLRLPENLRSEFTPYLVSCVVPPDRLIVNEWDISQLGDMEAEVISTAEYTDSLIIELKRDKVYELTAVWGEDKLKTNGFCGQAGYIVITE